MAKRFLLSSKAILNEIEKNGVALLDMGLTEYDMLAIIIEYLEVISQNKKVSVSEYLFNNWLLKDEVRRIIIKITNDVLSKLMVLCPELVDIIKGTDGLSIIYYDNHIFVLERISKV